jgi:hypothetical protein
MTMTGLDGPRQDGYFWPHFVTRRTAIRAQNTDAALTIYIKHARKLG